MEQQHPLLQQFSSGFLPVGKLAKAWS